MVFIRSKNGWTGVLYFTLYYRLLYGASYIVLFVEIGFRISESHVYYFQVGTLRYDVCKMQATLEKMYKYSNHACVLLITGSLDVMTVVATNCLTPLFTYGFCQTITWQGLTRSGRDVA